jgi:hypothetical protein
VRTGSDRSPTSTETATNQLNGTNHLGGPIVAALDLALSFGLHWAVEQQSVVMRRRDTETSCTAGGDQGKNQGWIAVEIHGDLLGSLIAVG